jgi:DNA-directed RNA polymerase alpha subunit
MNIKKARKQIEAINEILSNYDFTNDEVEILTEVREDLKALNNIEQLNLSYRAWATLHRAEVETIDEFIEFMFNIEKYNMRLPQGAGASTKSELLKAYNELTGDDV